MVCFRISVRKKEEISDSLLALGMEEAALGKSFRVFLSWRVVDGEDNRAVRRTGFILNVEFSACQRACQQAEKR